MGEGKFRADLLARIDLWHFALPGLAARREDIEPNLDYELARFAKKHGKHVTFNKEAKNLFLQYALSPAARWEGNFRELNAMIVRMATLSSGGRIDLETVREELERVREAPREEEKNDLLAGLLGTDCGERFDRFDLIQLGEVIGICRNCRTLAEAGKALFAVSRQARKSANDSDRLRKYLARFGLTFRQVTRSGEP